MAINRELSQFASFVEVDNNSKNIGIAATATPYVGIGTTNPTAKLDVVGQTELDDVNISGIATVGFITASNLFVSGISTINSIAFIPQGNSGGIVTAADFVGIITYYGDGSQLSGIGGAPGGGGADTQVIFNSSGSFSASPNLTFSNPNLTVGGGLTALSVKTTDLNVTGIATAQDFNSLSDFRYKKDIDTVTNALSKINDLRGVRFNWKESGLPSYGVVAQELEQVLPELVHGNDPKTVNYNGIIGVLIEAIKELNKEILSLKERIDK